MALAPGQGDLDPLDALDAEHDANRLALRLEDRPLLDMRFEEGAELPSADRPIAEIADALQFLAHGLAIEVLAAVAVLLGEHAREYARPGRGGREAGAHLVGPHRDLDR